MDRFGLSTVVVSGGNAPPPLPPKGMSHRQPLFNGVGGSQDYEVPKNIIPVKTTPAGGGAPFDFRFHPFNRLSLSPQLGEFAFRLQSNKKVTPQQSFGSFVVHVDSILYHRIQPQTSSFCVITVNTHLLSLSPIVFHFISPCCCCGYLSDGHVWCCWLTVLFILSHFPLYFCAVLQGCPILKVNTTV